MPHGGIALSPAHFNTSNETTREEAWMLHKACLQAGRLFRQLNADLIVLSTPHGLADLKQFMFYLNSQGYGYADTDNCVCPSCCFSVSVQIDANISQNIVQSLQRFGANVSSLTAYGPPGNDEQFPLRWGEVIPLYFMQSQHARVVILSQPLRRYDSDVAMVPELLQLGKQMYGILEALSERVVVVISGDLAHTHLPDGPYGYSNASEPYDKACGLWASTLDSSALLVTAAGLVDAALSCGFTGLVLLEGMFQASGIDNWTGQVLANFHPSYYGMMVATFARSNH